MARRQTRRDYRPVSACFALPAFVVSAGPGPDRSGDRSGAITGQDPDPATDPAGRPGPAAGSTPGRYFHVVKCYRDDVAARERARFLPGRRCQDPFTYDFHRTAEAGGFSCFPIRQQPTEAEAEARSPAKILRIHRRSLSTRPASRSPARPASTHSQAHGPTA